MSRRDVRVITAIWIVALVAAGEIWGENPTADEELYLAAFFVIAGSVMTGVYFLVRETRTKRKTGRLSLSTSGSEQTTTSSRGHRSPGWGVVDVFAVLVLWQVGYQIARLLFSETTSEFVGVLLPLAVLLVVRHVRRLRSPKS